MLYTILALAAVTEPMTGGTGQQKPQTITIAPGPIEEYREHSIIGKCGERSVKVKLTSNYRNGRSTFSASSGDRRPKAASLEAIETILERARGAFLGGFRCQMDNKISVALHGSYVDPEPGTDDDFVELVLVEFD